MNEEPIITEFDNMVQDEHHQLLKAALPYIQPKGQRFLSLYIKMQELRNTVDMLKEEENTLTACAYEKKKLSPIEMLSDIRKFCPKKDQETIDSLLNFINMYTLYTKYSQAFGNNERPEEKAEQLKSMLSPEQKSILEAYMSGLS